MRKVTTTPTTIPAIFPVAFVAFLVVVDGIRTFDDPVPVYEGLYVLADPAEGGGEGGGVMVIFGLSGYQANSTCDLPNNYRGNSPKKKWPKIRFAVPKQTRKQRNKERNKQKSCTYLFCGFQ